MKTLNFTAIVYIACLSITILSASETPQNQGYFSRLYTNIKQWLERTPLVPGWHATPEQKEKAHENLKQLLTDRDQLETELTRNKELSDEQIKAKHAQFTSLSKEIHNQKVILGEAWSNRRKLITGITTIGLGVIGTSAACDLNYKEAMRKMIITRNYNSRGRWQEFDNNEINIKKTSSIKEIETYIKNNENMNLYFTIVKPTSETIDDYTFCLPSLKKDFYYTNHRNSLMIDSKNNLSDCIKISKKGATTFDSLFIAYSYMPSMYIEVGRIFKGCLILDKSNVQFYSEITKTKLN